MKFPSNGPPLIRGGRKRGQLNPLDIDAILRTPPIPIPWVIEPWIVRGDIVCNAGEPKVGKSLVALNLAAALVSNTPFLGALQVLGGPYRIMYADAENNEAMMSRRIRRLLVGLEMTGGEFPSESLRYFCEPGLKLDDEAWYEEFVRVVDDFEPDFIFLDSLIRFHRGDENSNAAMSAFFCDRIKPVATKYRAGIFMTHHLSKPGPNSYSGDLCHRVRGASDILAAVDQLWTLELDTSGHLLLRHERSRWADTAPPISINIEDVNGGEGVRLTIEDVPVSVEGLLLQSLREAEAGGVLRKDIVAALRDAGLRAGDRLASKALGRLHERGVVRKLAEGRDMRYWLREHAPADAT